MSFCSEAWRQVASRLENAAGRIGRLLHRNIDDGVVQPATTAATHLPDETRRAAELLRGSLRDEPHSREQPGTSPDLTTRLNDRRPLCEVIDGRQREVFGHLASVARYDTPGGGRIWYSAQIHTRDPAHPQYPVIRSAFDRFMSEPNGRGRIALNEQNDIPDDIRELDLDDAVRRGDHYHVKRLALEHGIRGERGDVGLTDFVTTIDPGREPLHHLWYFLTQVKRMQRDGYPEDRIMAELREWVPGEDARLRESGRWPNPDGPRHLTFDGMLAWHEKYLGEPFDPNRPVQDMLNPDRIDSTNPVNEIARYRVNERETAILDCIDDRSNRGYDVFAGYGAGHYTIQREFLAQRYGEPLIYRPGQLSGELLTGATNPTPDDIRHGIAAVENRIAEADNPVDKQLLSEELRTLRHELEQRS
ncbi:hypothetical protein [Nocardia paucivorans]|uniref:hypothetical protein n=1 Tax=Nocardia paucivorans TaxID=114259 RepID=UPI0002DA882B|nr:hypothetical protein [Nocardia paucivorans]